MLRQLLSVPKDDHVGGSEGGNLAMLSNVTASSLPFSSSSVSGTSELFSSTFAMLSDGDGAILADNWDKPPISGYYDGSAALVSSDDFGRLIEPTVHGYDPNLHARMAFVGYPPMQQQQPHLMTMGYHPVVVPPSFSHLESSTQGSSLPHPGLLQGIGGTLLQPSVPQPSAAAPLTATMPVLNGSPDDGRPAGHSYSEALGTAKGAPIPGRMCDGGSPANGNGTMVTSPPKPGMVTATGEGGLSPICPHCERFISHYKGNIRRHINQCSKNGGKRLKQGPKSSSGSNGNSAKRRKFGPGESEWAASGTGEMTLYEHITTNGYMPPASNPLYDLPPSSTHSTPFASVAPAPLPTTPTHLPPVSSADHCGTPASTPNKKEPEVPDDPYLCPYCDFLTVYKGNMKRHLNTCHAAEQEKSETRLDDMRASVQGVAQDELNAKLNAHKANSTRGRKPKGKDINGCLLPSPTGGDNSLGSAGSSTTSPISSSDPYCRVAPPPLPLHYPTSFHHNPQHLLMVAPPPSQYYVPMPYHLDALGPPQMEAPKEECDDGIKTE